MATSTSSLSSDDELEETTGDRCILFTGKDLDAFCETKSAARAVVLAEIDQMLDEIGRALEDARSGSRTKGWMLDVPGTRYINMELKMKEKPVTLIKAPFVFPVNEPVALKLLDPWDTGHRPWPDNNKATEGGAPAFALKDTNLELAYRKMRREMLDFYQTVGEAALIPQNMANTLSQGTYVVIQCRGQCRGFERAKILSNGSLEFKQTGNDRQNDRYILLELVDQGTQVMTESDKLFFMYEPFHQLSPQALRVKLKEVEYYQNHKNRTQFLNRMMSSESGLWDGDLIGICRHPYKNSIYIFTPPMLPLKEMSSGLNGYIIRRLVLESPRCYPTKINQECNGVIIHSNEDGEIFVHFDSPFRDHQEKLMKTKTIQAVNSKDYRLFKVGTIVFAPYEDNNLYRGKILEINHLSKTAKVHFMDYGHDGWAGLEKMHLARRISPFYDVLPPTATKVILDKFDKMVLPSEGRLDRMYQFVEDQNCTYGFKATGFSGDGTPIVKIIKYFPRNSGEQDRMHEEFDGSYLTGTKEITKLPVEVKPLVTNDDLGLNRIPFDVIGSHGKRGFLYKAGQEIKFFIIDIEPDKNLVYVYPQQFHKRLVNLEKRINTYAELSFNSYRPIDEKYFVPGACIVVKNSKTFPDRAVRGMILQILDNCLFFYRVLFVDYGVEEKMHWTNFHRLKNQDSYFLAFGLQAKLYKDGESFNVFNLLETTFNGEIMKIKRTKLGVQLADIKVVNFESDRKDFAEKE